jgi:hypothetical protein
MLGKAVCLSAFGGVAGYYYHISVLADNARAASLTLQEYSADFEKYKSSLSLNEWPLWLNIALVLITVWGIFAIYEALGWACGRVVGRLLLLGSDGDSAPVGTKV